MNDETSTIPPRTAREIGTPLLTLASQLDAAADSGPTVELTAELARDLAAGLRELVEYWAMVEYFDRED